MDTTKRRIVSLATAAPGWRAIYRHDGGVTAREVTAWALIEQNGASPRSTENMIGIVLEDGWTAFADEVKGTAGLDFCGYAAPGEEPSQLVGRLDTAPAIGRSTRPRVKSFASNWFG